MQRPRKVKQAWSRTIARMAPLRFTPNGPPWLVVRQRLAELEEKLTPPELDSLDVAKGFAALAVAMLAAVRSSGAQSMRFGAVAKALDLKTPKSHLEAFLGLPEF